MVTKNFRRKAVKAVAGLLLVSQMAPFAVVYGQEMPQESEANEQVSETYIPETESQNDESFDTQQTAAAYQIGVEVRGLDGRRTGDAGITVSNNAGTVFEGTYNDYLQWRTAESLPEGSYYITLSTPEGTTSVINESTQQYSVATETPNTYLLTLDEEIFGDTTTVYGAFQLVADEEPVPTPDTFRLGVEVRGLDDKRTNEVGITVSNAEEEVFAGAYNEYSQWLSTEELPEGLYYISLATPEGTVSEINDSTQQFAVPTDTPDVYSINLTEANAGSTSAIYGAFRLIEDEEPVPTPDTFRLSVEVRGLDDRRTDDVGITVSNAEEEVFAGAYNEYLQWLSAEELPEGLYYISLATPEGTVSEINDSTQQFAVPTDTPDVYSINLTEANAGSTSAIYGAFRLVEDEEPVPTPDTFRLGVEVRGLDDRRTDDVGIRVTDTDGNRFEGSFNEYLQWLTEEELPEGTYRIALTTPEGTISEINDTTNQHAQATTLPNVYTIELNEENLGSSSAIYGAFRLVEDDEEPVPTPDAYRLGVEVRGLDNRRTDKVGIRVTNRNGQQFEGSYNEYLQWLTNDELPEGTYIITLNTPNGTVSEINRSTDQYAQATDQPNVYTIELNDDNLGSSSAIYGAFRLVEDDDGGSIPKPDNFLLGVEVRGLDDKRTDEVNITVRDRNGQRFGGSYNEYKVWLTHNKLPEGSYVIALETPEGTVSKINESVNQYAVATDRANVYTIELNEDNLGSNSAVFGGFKLVKTDQSGTPKPPKQDGDQGVLPATGESRNAAYSILAVGLLAFASLMFTQHKRSKE